MPTHQWNHSLVILALPQRLGDPVSNLRRDQDALNDVGEQAREILLADPRVSASALEAGAVVVEVPALLHLGRHRAATEPARHQAGERMLMLLVPGPVLGSNTSWTSSNSRREMIGVCRPA